MIKLVFSDLRDHASTWVGAFIVAVACGYIGGWVASLHATAGFYTDALYKNLQNAGTSVFVFSLIAAVAVLASAANLTVSTQRRSYALWQLVNVGPRLVTAVVLVQLAVVAGLGAVCGTLLAAITFEPLFPWVFDARETYGSVVPHVGLSAMPTVWTAVTAVFLCGGLKGARNAGKTPPLVALRDPAPQRRGMTWLRVLLFLGLAASTFSVSSLMITAGPDEVLNWSLYIPILVVATAVPMAPLVFSVLLTAWTALVPQRGWNAWYLARHTARYGLGTSTSVETPVMVGFGLVAGIFSIIRYGAAYAAQQGVTDFNGLDMTSTLLMLGGPVLLCAIGAAVSVVMSSRSRARDIALFTANGARPETLIAAAVCEAGIHTITATLVGAATVAASGALVSYAYGLPFWIGLTFGEGVVVSAVGFVLVLAATLIPTCMALRQETASLLAVRG